MGWRLLCHSHVTDLPSLVLMKLASEREEIGLASEIIAKPKDVKGFTKLQRRGSVEQPLFECRVADVSLRDMNKAWRASWPCVAS